MAYDLKTHKRTYKIVESRIQRTNYTRYEIFFRGEKVSGYIDRPSGPCCDLAFSMKRTREECLAAARRGDGKRR